MVAVIMNCKPSGKCQSSNL